VNGASEAPGAGRWAWITVLLYGTALGVLSGPLVIAAFASELKDGEAGKFLRSLFTPGESWGFWALLGGLTLLQGLALLAPIRLAQGRPVRRARWTALVAVASLLMALLVLAGGWTLAEVFLGELPDPSLAPFFLLGLSGWAVWAVVFGLWARRREGPAAVRGITRAMIAGSLAELLVAVPSHVIARKREYCCAGVLTFTGLAAGFVVLLFAFGPAVYFLFVDRFRRLRPADPP
jgi:hypothetical protein